MPYAFNGTTPNLNYAVNKLNRMNKGILQTIAEILGTIGGIVGGSGATASNAQVEAAVQWAINKADNNYITYSQKNRNLKNPNGTSFDCSSFIITAFYAVGVDINASTTSNMKAGFTAAGWTWVPGITWTSNALLRGDILLKAGVHTQMYIGNNQDVNCGSTPAHTQPHSIDNYGRGWDGILRLL